jgi:hypothetical protein
MVRTIGHGTRTTDELASLLVAAGVRTLIDVRRYPAGHRQPHLARERLALPLVRGLQRLHVDAPVSQRARRAGGSGPGRRSAGAVVRRDGVVALPSAPDRGCAGPRWLRRGAHHRSSSGWTSSAFEALRATNLQSGRHVLDMWMHERPPRDGQIQYHVGGQEGRCRREREFSGQDRRHHELVLMAVSISSPSSGITVRDRNALVSRQEPIADTADSL